ncbi:MAG: MBL fold metallo-hydrolase, partial [Methanothrix sp.]|nr:MBL fold metallo-hydrolase [Methanothrix sp.]
MKIEFYGAAGGVTGSHTVLDTGPFRLGVDAGLFQGREADRSQRDLGHDPRSLSAIVLTHAHIDHSGRIPLIVKEGFKGPVLTTPATADLCEILLKDSAHLMEEAAEHERRHHDIRHGQMGSLLYTHDDVLHSLRHLRPVAYGREHSIGGLSVRLKDAGHILGSAIIEVSLGRKRLVFSGDLGRPGSPFLRDPERVACLLYTSPSPRDSAVYLVWRLLLEKARGGGGGGGG